MNPGYAIFDTIAFVCIQYVYNIYASSANWHYQIINIYDLAFNIKRFPSAYSNREYTLELQIKLSFAIFAIIIHWGILIILKWYTSHISYILI